MHWLKWLAVAIASSAGSAALAGCALWSPDKAWTRDGTSYDLPVWTDDGLYFVSGRSGALFLAPSPRGLHAYRSVLLGDIRLLPKPGSRALKPAESERLEGYIRRRLEHVFARNGWSIATIAAPDVVRARVLVKDLELERARALNTGSVVARVSDDKITIVLELRDSIGHERRLLFADRRPLPFGVYAGTDAIAIRRVEDAFYYFSIDARRRLGQTLDGDFPPPARPGGSLRTFGGGAAGSRERAAPNGDGPAMRHS